VDATTDGIPLVRVGVERVSVEVSIPLIQVDIDSEDDGEEGADAATTDQRCSSGALIICEWARSSSSPARGCKRKPKKEDVAATAAPYLAIAEAAWAEDASVREAIVRSLQDLVPANNALSMDAALAWSRQDWEREEAEQQRRLLDLAAARRCTITAAPAATARVAPLIKLEDSNDDKWYRPTPPRIGDPGQGSSRWAPGQSSQQAPPP
jgi:hypothetical protein